VSFGVSPYGTTPFGGTSLVSGGVSLVSSTPASGATGVSSSANVTFQVNAPAEFDELTLSVKFNTVEVIRNGEFLAGYSGTIAFAGPDLDVSVTTHPAFSFGAVTVDITAYDLAGTLGSISYSFTIGLALDAALSGDATLVGSVDTIQALDAALSGSATLVGSVDGIQPLDAALSGDATLVGDAYIIQPLAATLSGSATLTGELSGSLFQVVSAQSLNSVTLVVIFSNPPDFTVASVVNPANYTFNGGLTAVRVLPDANPNAVRLLTVEQDYKLYVVTVGGTVTAVGGATVDPLANSGTFTGYPLTPKFLARVQGPTTVNVLFAQPMLVDAALTNTANYTIQSYSGVAIPVLSAVANTGSNATSVSLRVGAFPAGVPQVLTVSSNVKAADGRITQPNSANLTWGKIQNKTSISLSSFTGEVRARKFSPLGLSETLQLESSLSVVLAPLREGPVEVEALYDFIDLAEAVTVTGSGDPTTSHSISNTDTLRTHLYASVAAQPDLRNTSEVSLVDELFFQEGLTILPDLAQGLDPAISDLFGNPNGLVFFSPSLKTGGAPSSSLAVDEVKACTQSFDTYEFPKILDPNPFYTHGGGIKPTPIATLNNSVFYADFYRLKEAKYGVQDKRLDTVPTVVDLTASFTFTEVTYPPTRVALLNNPAWVVFNNGVAPPYPFITTDNLSPIPVGAVTYRRQYANPAEVLSLVEDGLQTLTATSVAVSDTLALSEDFDLTPGETVVQVNLDESLLIVEDVTTQLGVNFFEVLELVEGVTIL